MKRYVFFLSALILLCGCTSAVTQSNTPTQQPSESYESRLSHSHTVAALRELAGTPPEPSSTQPTTYSSVLDYISGAQFGSPPKAVASGQANYGFGGTGVTADTIYEQIKVPWYDPSFERLSHGTVGRPETPRHYKPGQVNMISLYQIYKHFGVILTIGDCFVPSDYFNHNMPCTLWSEEEGWYRSYSSYQDLGYALIYASKNVPATVNDGKPADSSYRYHFVTAEDVQQWKMQELQDKVDRLEQQQQQQY